MIWLWVIALLIVAALAYVRLVPAKTDAVHCAVKKSKNADGKGYCVRVMEAWPDALAQVDAAMMDLPRTRRLAGSVDGGRVTYETRTKWVGFPDYTTVELDGDQIKMYGRLRFGRTDFGVNRARLMKVLKTAQG